MSRKSDRPAYYLNANVTLLFAFLLLAARPLILMLLPLINRTELYFLCFSLSLSSSFPTIFGLIFSKKWLLVTFWGEKWLLVTSCEKVIKWHPCVWLQEEWSKIITKTRRKFTKTRKIHQKPKKNPPKPPKKSTKNQMFHSGRFTRNEWQKWDSRANLPNELKGSEVNAQDM